MDDLSAEGSDPVFDLEQLRANTGDDVELAVEIIGLFQEQVTLWSRLLDPALPQAQWADAAHSLKGAAAGVGARQLVAACSRAEAAGRAEDTIGATQAAVLLSEVKDTVGPAIEAAAKAAHKLTSTASFEEGG